MCGVDEVVVFIARLHTLLHKFVAQEGIYSKGNIIVVKCNIQHPIYTYMYIYIYTYTGLYIYIYTYVSKYVVLSILGIY